MNRNNNNKNNVSYIGGESSYPHIPDVDAEMVHAFVTSLRIAAAKKKCGYTFSDACDLYLDRGNIGDTDAMYLNRLRDEIGDVGLEKFTRNGIEATVTADRVSRGLAPTSIRRELTTMQAILNYAKEMELTDNLVKIRKPRGDKRREVWLTQDKVDEFTAIGDADFRRFTMFLFYTGCRLGEALKAKWSDVLRVGNGMVLQVKSRKGRGSVEKIRSIPLHPKLLAVIGTGGSGKILRREGGASWSRGAFYDKWNVAKVEIGVDDLTPHCARHTFASLLIIAGVDSRVVAELLGHSSMDMMKRYTHLNTAHLSEAVSKLGV